jgi:hypothetical protein
VGGDCPLLECPVPVPGLPSHPSATASPQDKRVPSQSERPSREWPVVAGTAKLLDFPIAQMSRPSPDVPSRSRRLVPVPVSRCPVPLRALRPVAASRRPTFQKGLFFLSRKCPVPCPVPVPSHLSRSGMGPSALSTPTTDKGPDRISGGSAGENSQRPKSCGQKLYSGGGRLASPCGTASALTFHCDTKVSSVRDEFPQELAG